jgi:hypothetical protein
VLIYPLEEGHFAQRGVAVTTETVLTILVLGGVGGWFVGRSWAEDARSRFEQKKNWNARQDYRKKSD